MLPVNTGLPHYAVGVEPVEGKQGRPRRGLALLLAFFVTGLGQAYLGYWRRAWLWATAPLLAYLALSYSVMHFELRAAYSWFMPVMLMFWIGPRIAAFIETRTLPARRVATSGAVRLVLFSLASLFYAFVLTAFESNYVARALKLASGSMAPTLIIDDHILVNRRAFSSRSPQRGELVAFSHPEEPGSEYLKRVVGLPGDHLEVVDGDVRINGWSVPRCWLGQVQFDSTGVGRLDLEFLGNSAYLVFWSSEHQNPRGAWTVAPGELFVLGDHRNNSPDSRSWRQGQGAGVPNELVLGRPAFVWLAFDFEGNVDWPRLGYVPDHPRLLKGMEALQTVLDACLAKRPPRSQTERPAPH